MAARKATDEEIIKALQGRTVVEAVRVDHPSLIEETNQQCIVHR